LIEKSPAARSNWQHNNNNMTQEQYKQKEAEIKAASIWYLGDGSWWSDMKRIFDEIK